MAIKGTIVQEGDITNTPTLENQQGPISGEIVTQEDVINSFKADLPEVPLKIRFLVEGAPNERSRIATLKKFYPDVQSLADRNYLLRDKKGKTFIFDDREKKNFADFIDASKEITEAVAATGGAIFGSAAGPAGTVLGAGAGGAAGNEVFERVAQLFGTEILRTNSEFLADVGTDFAYNSVGQLVMPLLFKGGQKLLLGGKTEVAKKLPSGQIKTKVVPGDVLARQRIEAFTNAGASPSLGQVSQNRGVQTFELILGNIPGSSGKVAKFAQKAQDDIGKNVAKQVQANLGKNYAKTLKSIEKGTYLNKLIDDNIVGKTVQAGLDTGRRVTIKNAKQLFLPSNANEAANLGFIQRFKSNAGYLFGKVDQFIPKKAKFTLNNTSKYLADEFGSIPGLTKAESAKISQLVDDNFMIGINKELGQLIKKYRGAIPYQAFKSIKSKVGNKLSNLRPLETIDRAAVKRLYGSLSDDFVENVTKINPSKDALKAAQRAANYYAAGLDRIDDFLIPIINKTNPDKVAKSLIGGLKDGASEILRIKRSLKPDQFKVFISSVIDKMGRSQASRGVDTGLTSSLGNFSTESFLTNYMKLADPVKRLVFDSLEPGLKKAVDSIVDASSLIRESGKTFLNPSGTADRLVGQGLLLGGVIGAPFNPAFLAMYPLAFLGSKGLASSIFLNPSFAKWAAQAVKIAGNKGTSGVIEHLGRIGTTTAAPFEPEFNQAILEFLQGTQEVAENIDIEKEEGEVSLAKAPVKKSEDYDIKISNLEVPRVNMFEPQQVATSRVQPAATSVAMNRPLPQGGISDLARAQDFSALFPQDALGALIARGGRG